MRPTLKKVIAGVTTLATAAVVVPLLTATPAFATPPSPQTGATLSPTSGIGSTSFNLSLPIGASCPGDANAGWRVNTYMVPATVDPATIQWNNSGPVPIATGTNFRQPLYSPTGDVYSSLFTAAADTPGGPGLILALGPADFEVLAPGDIPAGAYNLGIACTNGPASTTQLDKFWNAKMTITANPAGGAAQVSWAVGAVPAAPTLTAVTPADGTLTAAFTPPAGSDPAVTGFTATATPTSGPAVTATGATSPITIPGLTNGMSYSVTVRATNAVGNSAESNALPGTPNLTRVPVQNLVATPGTGTVDLSWTAPSDAATYPPNGYTVTNVPADGTVVVTGTTAAASGLTAGTPYVFTVTPTYASGPAGAPATVSSTPVSEQVLLQDVTVTRPTGALVLTQVCGVNGVIPADTSGTAGFPNGSLPEIPATLDGDPGTSGPTLTAGGGDVDPLYDLGEYPYPDLADGTSNATYNTHCGVDLLDAQFVKSGPGAGQYFAASGVLDQVTIVDTRDEDTGWTVSGSMSRFINQVDEMKSFAGSQLGWTPKVSSTSPAFTDSDGIVYNQEATKGAKLNPGLIEPSGLGGGATLANSGTGAVAAAPGLGIAQLDARLKLLIPVTKRSGAYTGTLTITVT